MKRKRKFLGKPGGKSLKIIRQYFPKVKTVVDATSRAIIQVKPEDAKDGRVKQPALCAFARACYRSFHAQGVLIGLGTSYVIMGDTAIRYKNAETLSREIVSFDRNAGFDLGRYLLTPFAPAARFGVYRGTPTHSANGGPDRRKFVHFTKKVRVLSTSGSETR